MKEVLKLTDTEKQRLTSTVKIMLKGILAADEKATSLEPKFTSLGIANTAENRRRFRECLFTTPNLEEYVGGVILNEETFDQLDDNGISLVDHLLSKNIEIGVKVDKGLMDFNEFEKISVGLEDLEARLHDTRFEKATFCKWRSLFKITEELPSDHCIEQNCLVLCKYAFIAQMSGRVPIIEPEISLEGNYTRERMRLVAKRIYGTLFRIASEMDLFLPGIIMKCSFITEGNKCRESSEACVLGSVNVSVISECIPRAVGGIVFLSGGHSTEESFELLSLIHRHNPYEDLIFSFSFCRALTGCVMAQWAVDRDEVREAQKKFVEVLDQCQAANRGSEMF